MARLASTARGGRGGRTNEYSALGRPAARGNQENPPSVSDEARNGTDSAGNLADNARSGMNIFS